MDFSECPTDAIIAGIRYAVDNGARIINLSLGGPDASAAELEAVQYAVQHGAFIAAAMGNSGDEGNAEGCPGRPCVDGWTDVGWRHQQSQRARGVLVVRRAPRDYGAGRREHRCSASTKVSSGK